MPFDLSTVNWTFVGVMTLLAFVAALLGGLIAFRNPLAGASLPQSSLPLASSLGTTIRTTLGFRLSRQSEWTERPARVDVQRPIALHLSAPTALCGQHDLPCALGQRRLRGEKKRCRRRSQALQAHARTQPARAHARRHLWRPSRRARGKPQRAGHCGYARCYGRP